jgi:hypothetical protein
LAVLREPETDPVDERSPEGFEFIGYDVIEEATEISAINNCVHFGEAFCPEDLNQWGVISDFSRAYTVRKRLAERYPGDNHADCAVWAIWRKRTA